MAKFLALWEMDTTRVPVDPKERLTAQTMMVNMTKDDLKSGRLTDWGMFAGGLRGYAVAEGTEQEIALGTARFAPYVKFEIHPILSVSQVEEMLKAPSQA